MFRSYIIGLMVALSCAPAFAAPAAAQAPPQGAPQAAPQSAQPAPPQRKILAVNAPENKLHLTADQQEKMYAILDKAGAKARAMQSDAKTPDAAKKTEFTALQNSVQQQELDVMTPPQQIAFKRAIAEQAKYRAGIMQIAQQSQQLQQKLTATITPAQKQKLTAISSDMRAYATLLQADKTLTDDQRRAKFQVKLVDANKKMAALLTPSQHAIFDKLNSMGASLAVEEKLFQSAGI